MSRINYDLTKIKAVVFDIDGVLSPSTIPVGPDGMPIRMANLKDAYAMQLAIKSGLKLAVISGGSTQSMMGYFSLIGIKDVFLGVAEKLPVFVSWLESNKLNPEEVAYIGDDIPDLPVMKACGLSVAPRDAAAEVKMEALYISYADGGCGVARELLEEILKVGGHWLSQNKAYEW